MFGKVLVVCEVRRGVKTLWVVVGSNVVNALARSRVRVDIKRAQLVNVSRTGSVGGLRIRKIIKRRAREKSPI